MESLDGIDWMNGKVDAETVKLYVDANPRHMKPISIKGIPEGFSYIHDTHRPVGSYIKVAYLIGFTPGYQWKRLGAMYYKPIVMAKDSTKEELEKEIEDQSAALAQLYKNNLKNINNTKDEQ